MGRYILLWAVCFGLLLTGRDLYGQACAGCTFTIEVDGTESGTFTPPEDATVCITGNGIFDGELNLEGSSTICIDTGVTYEHSDDEMWEGSWTVENHGTFENSKEMEIQLGQTFNNYGHFEIVLLEAATDNELVIREGGRLYNEGSVYVSGDIINHGELESSGTIELDNEFKNMGTGFADVTSVIGKGDMTNDGTINLRGIIESLEGAFYNRSAGTINGFGDPCVYIKAATEVENQGMLDGTNGAVVLHAEDQEYDKSGSEVPEVIWNDGTNNHDCLEALRILPVVWQDLSATFFQKDRNVRIDWSTAKEWENSHFEVERSEGDTGHFKLIGRVESLGWASSLTTYSFEDTLLPLGGGRVYYRIKQVDLDGAYAYSKVLTIKLPEREVQKGVWILYPNPPHGERVSIALLDKRAYQDEQIRFRICNALQSSAFVHVPSIEFLDEAVNEAIVRFSKGLLILEIQWGQQVQYIKIIQ